MRRPEALEFYQPPSLQEASRILKDKGPGGRFLAGGTDLVIAIKEKGLIPKYVVDLKRIPKLSGIREQTDGSVVIGALTTMREVETSAVITRRYPFLARSAAEVGSIQIRNRATIGGNMANATPSADVAPSLLVLEARAKISGLGGERVVELEKFFLGPGQNAMQPEEILTEIILPPVSSTLGRGIHQILAARDDGPGLRWGRGSAGRRRQRPPLRACQDRSWGRFPNADESEKCRGDRTEPCANRRSGGKGRGRSGRGK